MDYRRLNDESDTDDDNSNEMAAPPLPVMDPRLLNELPDQAMTDISSNILPSEILPSESTSQLDSSQLSTATTVVWPWQYFQTVKNDRAQVVRRTRKEKKIDNDIFYILEREDGQPCKWKTSDSIQQTSTTNMANYLANVYKILKSRVVPKKEKLVTLMKLWTRQDKMSIQELFEKNLLRWIVAAKRPFDTIESLEFQQIFLDIPGIDLPYRNRHSVRNRIAEKFLASRANLIAELEATCSTIAFSLDVWTSENNLPILGIIGHWFTKEFTYMERVLEFKELEGIHFGENLAEVVYILLQELKIKEKLITITADNASNNDTLCSELYDRLLSQYSPNQEEEDVNLMETLDPMPTTTPFLFQGLDSQIRCLAHILNLIVHDILAALKSGTCKEAKHLCNEIANREITCKTINTYSTFARLRILALWIDRNSSRKKNQKQICLIHQLKDKYIQYDVDNWQNSTYRMLDDGIKARQQVEKFLQYETTVIPPFTNANQDRLIQIHLVLKKFEEFTLFISKSSPQISISLAIYYELHDLLNEVVEGTGEFEKLDEDIRLAVKAGMIKYQKYYTFMDDSDIYYLAAILDPRVKGDLIVKEQEDKDAAKLIVNAIRNRLHKEFLQEKKVELPNLGN